MIWQVPFVGYREQAVLEGFVKVEQSSSGRGF